MWILLNDAVFSIVRKPETPAGMLHVRSRRADDIPNVFGVRATVTPRGDYRFRADIDEAAVVAVISRRLLDIDYDNFKDSTHDPDLKRAYGSVWSTLGDLQPGGPYGVNGGLFGRWGGGGKRGKKARHRRSLADLYPLPEDQRRGLGRSCADCGEDADTRHKGRSLCNRCATFHGAPGVDMDDFDPAWP